MTNFEEKIRRIMHLEDYTYSSEVAIANKEAKLTGEQWDNLVREDKKQWAITKMIALFAQQREAIVKEIREQFINIAIEGQNINSEWKGFDLYSKTLQYLDKLKEAK